MRSADGFDRAALAMGLASLASLAFVFIQGDLGLVKLGGGAIVVAAVLGLLACVAGWFGRRMLALAAGVGFLVAAAVLLVLLGVRGNGGVLDGSGSTFSLWLGLGVGLVIVGRTARPSKG
jgi:hypothetical protein